MLVADPVGSGYVAQTVSGEPPVPTPWLCRNTMISRTAFCSTQAERPPRSIDEPFISGWLQRYRNPRCLGWRIWCDRAAL